MKKSRNEGHTKISKPTVVTYFAIFIVITVIFCQDVGKFVFMVSVLQPVSIVIVLQPVSMVTPYLHSDCQSRFLPHQVYKEVVVQFCDLAHRLMLMAESKITKNLTHLAFG